MQYHVDCNGKGATVSLFEKGNTIGAAGRPKGVRNRLDAHCYAVALAHVQHKRGDPAPAEYEKTSFWIALDVMLRTNARDYAKAIISMLPKEVSFDYTVNRVGEIDKLIQVFEEQIALADLADERKLIEHDHTSH